MQRKRILGPRSTAVVFKIVLCGLIGVGGAAGRRCFAQAWSPSASSAPASGQSPKKTGSPTRMTREEYERRKKIVLERRRRRAAALAEPSGPTLEDVGRRFYIGALLGALKPAHDEFVTGVSLGLEVGGRLNPRFALGGYGFFWSQKEIISSSLSSTITLIPFGLELRWIDRFLYGGARLGGLFQQAKLTAKNASQSASEMQLCPGAVVGVDFLVLSRVSVGAAVNLFYAFAYPENYFLFGGYATGRFWL